MFLVCYYLYLGDMYVCLLNHSNISQTKIHRVRISWRAARMLGGWFSPSALEDEIPIESSPEACRILVQINARRRGARKRSSAEDLLAQVLQGLFLSRGHTERPHPQKSYLIAYNYWGWGLAVWPLLLFFLPSAMIRAQS